MVSRIRLGIEPTGLRGGGPISAAIVTITKASRSVPRSVPLTEATAGMRVHGICFKARVHLYDIKWPSAHSFLSQVLFT